MSRTVSKIELFDELDALRLDIYNPTSEMYALRYLRNNYGILKDVAERLVQEYMYIKLSLDKKRTAAKIQELKQAGHNVVETHSAHVKKDISDLL